MKLWWSISLCLTTKLLLSQNLVPNPSFEYPGEPCGFVRYGAEFTQVGGGWNSPTGGTPDAFSTLSPSYCFASMPKSTLDATTIGSQSPRTGIHFSGFNNISIGRSDIYREYIQTQLTEPLIIGEYYTATMYVSLAEGPTHASNNIGMYFSASEYVDYSNVSYLHYTPQVNTSEVITEVLGWVKVCGTFKATTAAQYLIVGNFLPNDSTKVVYKAGTGYRPPGDPNFAYYFIDDVSVEKVPKHFIFSGNNPVCANQYTIEGVSGNFDQFSWSPQADTNKIISTSKFLKTKLSATTTFRVTASGCGAVVKDTITIKVNPIPQTHLGNDTTLCPNTSYKLDAGSADSYLWQDHSTDRYYTVDKAGTYNVAVTNQFQCTDTATVHVKVRQPPLANLGHDSLACSHFFPLIAANGDRYLWSTGATDSVMVPDAAGKYWVNIQNQCGQSSDTVRVYSISDLYIPNVVTPNGDPFNEKFHFNGIGKEFHCSIVINNRWGNEIYSNSDYKSDWPTEQHPEAGTYYYMVTFRGCRSFKGWLQIIR